MKLDRIISNLIEDYSSIDLRIVAYKNEGSWNAAILSIRFRVESVDKVLKDQKHLLDNCGEINKKNFCVKLISLPITKWDEIRSNWDKEFISFSPNFAVNIKNIGEFNSEPSFHFNRNDALFFNVKSFNTQHGDESINRILEQHDEEAQQLLCNDIYEYVSKIFQLSEDQIKNNYQNIITIPIFFGIDHIEFRENEVLIKYHTSYKQNLTFVLEVYQDQFARNSLSRDKISINYSNNSLVRSFNTRKFLQNYFMLKVFKNTVPIAKEENKISNHYPSMSEITNPIMSVFENFVSVQELKKNLFSLTAKKLNNESDVFERGISWLMNLLGFSTIWLGEYDQADGKDRPSFDLIAHEKPNRIYLINVKTKTISADLIDKEKRYRMKMEEYFGNKMKFHSILFTSESTSLSDKASANQVNLLGRERLKQIVELLEKGDLDEARKIVTTIPSHTSFYSDLGL